MIKRLLILLLLIGFGLASRAGEAGDLNLEAMIRQLALLRKQTINAPDDDTRKAVNKEFLDLMRKTLQEDGSFEASFDSIPMIADLKSGDGYFRMINWNLPHDDQSHRYFCFVQYFDKKEEAYKVVELKKGHRDLKGQHRKIFSEKDWYGALYYDIIPSKTRGRKRKRAYMLLGWDGHDQYSSLKVIDVLMITKRGIRFGNDIFDYPYESNIKRYILEYKSDAYVSLKYDDRRKRFVFNQLVPLQPDLQGMYEFYIPILEFNAFEWKKRRWTYVEDVDVKTDTRGRLYNEPPEAQNIR